MPFRKTLTKSFIAASAVGLGFGIVATIYPITKFISRIFHLRRAEPTYPDLETGLVYDETTDSDSDSESYFGYRSIRRPIVTEPETLFRILTDSDEEFEEPRPANLHRRRRGADIKPIDSLQSRPSIPEFVRVTDLRYGGENNDSRSLWDDYLDISNRLVEEEECNRYLQKRLYDSQREMSALCEELEEGLQEAQSELAALYEVVKVANDSSCTATEALMASERELKGTREELKGLRKQRSKFIAKFFKTFGRRSQARI